MHKINTFFFNLISISINLIESFSWRLKNYFVLDIFVNQKVVWPICEQNNVKRVNRWANPFITLCVRSYQILWNRYSNKALSAIPRHTKSNRKVVQSLRSRLCEEYWLFMQILTWFSNGRSNIWLYFSLSVANKNELEYLVFMFMIYHTQQIQILFNFLLFRNRWWFNTACLFPQYAHQSFV